MWLALWQQAVFIGDDLVQELTNHAGWNSAAALVGVEPQRLKGRTAVLYTEGASLLSHWLFDTVPKFDVLCKYGLSLSDIDHFILADCSQSFHIEALQRLGIPESKIVVPTPAGRFYALDDAFVVSNVRHNFIAGAWVFEAARQIYGQTGAAARTDLKLYISRSRANRRRILNESELIPLLYDRGYSIVWAELMSVSTIGSIIAGADRFVSLHGAGIANSAFGRGGLKVLELYGRHLSSEYGVNSSTCGFDHALVGVTDDQGLMPWEGTSMRDFHQENAQNVVIDPGLFAAALDSL